MKTTLGDLQHGQGYAVNFENDMQTEFRRINNYPPYVVIITKKEDAIAFVEYHNTKH